MANAQAATAPQTAAEPKVFTPKGMVAESEVKAHPSEYGFGPGFKTAAEQRAVQIGKVVQGQTITGQVGEGREAVYYAGAQRVGTAGEIRTGLARVATAPPGQYSQARQAQARAELEAVTAAPKVTPATTTEFLAASEPGTVLTATQGGKTEAVAVKTTTGIRVLQPETFAKVVESEKPQPEPTGPGFTTFSSAVGNEGEYARVARVNAFFEKPRTSAEVAEAQKSGQIRLTAKELSEYYDKLQQAQREMELQRKVAETELRSPFSPEALAERGARNVRTLEESEKFFMKTGFVSGAAFAKTITMSVKAGPEYHPSAGFVETSLREFPLSFPGRVAVGAITTAQLFKESPKETLSYIVPKIGSAATSPTSIAIGGVLAASIAGAPIAAIPGTILVFGTAAAETALRGGDVKRTVGSLAVQSAAVGAVFKATEAVSSVPGRIIYTQSPDYPFRAAELTVKGSASAAIPKNFESPPIGELVLPKGGFYSAIVDFVSASKTGTIKGSAAEMTRLTALGMESTRPAPVDIDIAFQTPGEIKALTEYMSARFKIAEAPSPTKGGLLVEKVTGASADVKLGDKVASQNFLDVATGRTVRLQTLPDQLGRKLEAVTNPEKAYRVFEVPGVQAAKGQNYLKAIEEARAEGRIPFTTEEIIMKKDIIDTVDIMKKVEPSMSVPSVSKSPFREAPMIEKEGVFSITRPQPSPLEIAIVRQVGLPGQLATEVKQSPIRTFSESQKTPGLMEGSTAPRVETTRTFIESQKTPGLMEGSAAPSVETMKTWIESQRVLTIKSPLLVPTPVKGVVSPSVEPMKTWIESQRTLGLMEGAAKPSVSPLTTWLESQKVPGLLSTEIQIQPVRPIVSPAETFERSAAFVSTDLNLRGPIPSSFAKETAQLRESSYPSKSSGVGESIGFLAGIRPSIPEKSPYPSASISVSYPLRASMSGSAFKSPSPPISASLIYASPSPSPSLSASVSPPYPSPSVSISPSPPSSSIQASISSGGSGSSLGASNLISPQLPPLVYVPAPKKKLPKPKGRPKGLYTPSLVGILSGRTIKAPPKGTLTGLEVRLPVKGSFTAKRSGTVRRLLGIK